MGVIPFSERRTMSENPWLKLLKPSQVPLPEGAAVLWARHAALVREWNPIYNLVSARDALLLETVHVPDAVSLAPVLAHLGLAGGRLLDIGPGGGYPALPLKIALPGLHLTLMERSARKADFLRRVVALLGLTGVDVLEGEFPHCADDIAVDVVTARAVERPEKVHKALSQWMRPGMVFLCQTTPGRVFSPDLFHVEQIEDAWTRSGARRGELIIIRRK